jgi:signal transduction histidine kinase/CheY-like chemotaxis protein
MKNLFKKIWLLAVFTLGIFIAFGQQHIFPEKGVIDLRNAKIGEQVSLKGEWLFYYNQLLQPNQIDFSKPSYASYPLLWKEMEQGGKKLSSKGYATYALTILLPANKPSLALWVPDTYSSYKLFVNEKAVSENGTPAANIEEAKPFWSTKIVTLPDADTLRLVLQVANFWHYKGGPYKDMKLGSRDAVLLEYKRATAFDMILAGCLFMGGLFFLGLFIFSRQDKPILYFSLFCIVYSYRLVGTQLYVLHEILPELPWILTIHFEYLSLVLGVGFFGKYIQSLYPNDTNKLYMNFLMALCSLYILVIILFPPAVFTPLITFFLTVMFFYIAYAFAVYVKALRNKRSGSFYALLSSGILLLIFLLINLEYFNIIPSLKAFIFVLYIAFFFLQSLVLSHRFSEQLKAAAENARQGLKARSEFLSTMSHEIRTPLNSVIGMAHLLQRSEPRKDQQQNLDVLMFSAGNLLSIVNNILDYSKLEAGRINFEQTAMDLTALAGNIVAGLKTLANEKMISLVLETDPRLTQKLIGDPTRTGQVLNNLVQNAIKFTTEGEVKLSLQVQSISADSVTLRIAITDTGIGIPKEKHKMIFERFTQADSSTSRSYGGTGLGLSISSRILELQGSKLELESEPGKGSCFYFVQTFALAHEKTKGLQPEKPLLPESSLPFRDLGILLVEDNPMNVLVAQTFLERCGATIEVATNGQEALDLFDATKHKLILMDLDMPVMDGYEATQQLRQKGERVPVIALTASLPSEVEDQVYSAGLSDIMVKPFNPDDLYRVIREHVG